jgi:hypothetical protein
MIDGVGGAEDRIGVAHPRQTISNLRAQLTQFELLVLHVSARLTRAQSEAQVFAEAARERLVLLTAADEEIRAQQAAVLELNGRLESERLAAQGRESAWLQAQALLQEEVAELRRALTEAAHSESTARRELLELRNEGLIHSFFRHLNNILRLR